LQTGTGKSFIGSLIAKAIHSHSDEKILVVCFTHHALDQFLEDLLNLGIPDIDIVRLGSAKKATAMTQSLAIKQAISGMKLTREQCHMLDTIRQEASDEGDALQKAFVNFEQASFSKDDILEHLEFRIEGPLFYSAFEIPNERGGMKRVGKKGRAVDRFYLLERWCRGKDPGMFKTNASAFPEVWGMKSADRIKSLREWQSEMLKERLDAMRMAGIGYNDALDRINSIYMEKDLAILRTKRIIACTTTAAAKYVQCLQSVHPGVLLVEEAGEILESHILTALGPDTKQLILIGDHKQLRPKVHYDLSVEKGDGYDLNRSLFERLVLRSYPHTTLYEQHRMRPELAEFVRELTYPDLVDAPITKKRKDIQGLQDNMVFLNHAQNEIDMKDVPDWKDNTSTSSKKNPFEAKMALKCVRYLGQQDYKTDNIVILTPYLGQLRLLVDELGKDNDPVLNDLDSHDLVRAGLMPAATAQVDKPRIRISTVGEFPHMCVVDVVKNLATYPFLLSVVRHR
jgi:AAA domain